MTTKERRQIDRFFAKRFKLHIKHPIHHDLCDTCQAVLEGQIEEGEYYCCCSDTPLKIEAFGSAVYDIWEKYPSLTTEDFISIANSRVPVHLHAFEMILEGTDRRSWHTSWHELSYDQQLLRRLKRPGIFSVIRQSLEELLPAQHRQDILGDAEEDFLPHCQKWGFVFARLLLFWQIIKSVYDYRRLSL